jgi:Protein of unknown function (DUF3892)
MTRQVTCITKRGDHYNPHERIQGIGGGASLLTRWWRAEADAISDVKLDPESYYVSAHGRSVWVIVAKHQGREYLKTETDDYSPDNLLSLTECPL